MRWPLVAFALVAVSCVASIGDFPFASNVPTPAAEALDACVPNTCASVSASCGSISDGCGATLDCGECAAPLACGGGGTPNVCGAGSCAPTTCAALGKNCGAVSDGCAATLDCGSCPAPYVCGGAGMANLCGLPGGDGGINPGDGGPCSLSTQLVTTTISTGSDTPNSVWPVILAPLPGDNAVIGWSSFNGGMHLTRVDASGARVGNDLVIPAESGHALAVTPLGYAALVRRFPKDAGYSDELWLVQLDPNGAVLNEQKLIGGNDPATIGDEWFDAFFRRGRLLWNGKQLAAYYTLQRRWPDNVAHEGDQLRFFELDGGQSGYGWGWGCSHSLDVRLAANANRFAPVCLSDCYPAKAVMFNHDERTIFADPSGNCAGYSAANLGGVVAEPGGFYVTFSSPEGRGNSDVAIAHVSNTGEVSPPNWLTTDAGDQAPHLAAYGATMLTGWRQGYNSYFLAQLDSGGNLISGPEPTSAPIGDTDDFVTYPSGDVGWASASNNAIQLVRVKRCP